MKVFLINLDKDKDRLASADAQLKRLSVDYERVSGVYGKDLAEPERSVAVNRFRWWCAVGRKIVPAEIGVALSHYGIYQRIGGAPVCILEDDVVLDERFPSSLDEIERFISAAKPQVVLLSSHECVREGTGIKRSTSGICADGYVITPAAAQVILKANLPMVTPCDWWGRWAKKGVIELYHYLPFVVRQNQERFGTSTQANVVAVKDYSLPHWLWHKALRVVGKSMDRTWEIMGF